MRFMPEGYTVKKLLLGWLAHFLISAAGGFIVALIGLDWTHSIGYPTAAYGFREGEQVMKRSKRGAAEIWPKTILDVVFAALGGFVGMLVKGLL